jgi:hypothetical protein
MPETRATVQLRSKLHCILTNVLSRKQTTHQVAHVVAKHCSPNAFLMFTRNLSRLVPGLPVMPDLQQPWNPAWLSTAVHGPLDCESWSVYVPDFVVDRLTLNITADIEIHQFKTTVDMVNRGCHDPLTTAIDQVNLARKVSSYLILGRFF